MIELIASCAMLAVAMSLAVPMILSAAHARRATEQRQFASQYASNVLDRESARPWAELVVGNRKDDAVPSDLATLLPGVESTVEVHEPSGEPRSKRVAVSLRWKDRAGEFVKPLRLTSWVYASGEAQP